MQNCEIMVFILCEFHELLLLFCLFNFFLIFRLSAVFEVDTDLQKAVTSKITAELAWPSLLGSQHQLDFSLTNTNGSSVSLGIVNRVKLNIFYPFYIINLNLNLFHQEEEIVLENPADVPVFAQLLPIALYSNPSFFVDKLLDR